jgi:cell division cycle 2-like protein
MAEMLTKEPLFTGKGEIDQLDKVFINSCSGTLSI